jgi:hypothetical protein
MSFFSGWFFIARANPPPPEIGTIIKGSKWSTLNINYFAAYRGLINIDITDKGILFRPSCFILIMHKPIFILWKNIHLQSYKSGILEMVTFDAGRCRFAVFGPISRDIFKYSRVFAQSSG